MEIAFVISKANAYYVAFLLMCFFYLGALLFLGGSKAVNSHSSIFPLIIGAPIYFFELIWLFQDEFAKRLVKEHGKLLKYRSGRR